MKHSGKEKFRLAKLHVEEGVPLHEICKNYDIAFENLKYNVNLYKRWGEQAFKDDNVRRKYTREFKLEAIHDVITNKISYRKKSVELMLKDPGILRDWVNMYKEYGEEAITDTYSREAYKHHDEKVLEKEHKKLLEDLQRTKAENEYLKKLYSLSLKRSEQRKKK